MPTGITLTFAALAALAIAACSSSSAPGASQGEYCDFADGPSPDASAARDACNPCPASYSAAQPLCTPGVACTPIGLRCWYPGAGDGSGSSAATALLACSDLGTDGGTTGQWRCAQ